MHIALRRYVVAYLFYQAYVFYSVAWGFDFLCVISRLLFHFVFYLFNLRSGMSFVGISFVFDFYMICVRCVF